MISMGDKVVTIRCTIKAMELLRQLAFVWDDENDGDFSFVTSWVEFEYGEGVEIGYLKLSPSFLECLCNGGYLSDDELHEHTLQIEQDFMKEDTDA